MRELTKSNSLWVAFCIAQVPLIWSCDSGPEPDAGADGDADADADHDLDRDRDDASPDGDADGDNPCLPDPDGDVDSDVDSDIDADVDSDSDADADADSDADIDGDADADDDADEDDDWDWDLDLDPCPDDMVAAGPLCIDIWEASRSDATADDQGVETGQAFSRPGVIPWFVNPMSTEVLAQFEAACALAGKRLCTAREWGRVCSGPAESDYVFGDIFDREACNCVDTFCDDHCVENSIPEEECVSTDNCGYSYSCYHVVPTGQFPSCTNELGTYDVGGNVWEIVVTEDERGYGVRGGAFNCARAWERLQCIYSAGWDGLYAGFRCCKDR